MTPAIMAMSRTRLKIKTMSRARLKIKTRNDTF
jgi:hypothetical protein